METLKLIAPAQQHLPEQSLLSSLPLSASGQAQLSRCRLHGSEVAALLPLTGYVAHHYKIELYYLPKYTREYRTST